MAAGWRADKEKATVKEDEDRPKRRRTAEQHSVYERVSLLVKLIFRHLPLWSLFYLFIYIILFHVLCVCLEQKRRSRIQEKLRTLQEMVPNAGKVSSLFISFSIIHIKINKSIGH